MARYFPTPGKPYTFEVSMRRTLPILTGSVLFACCIAQGQQSKTAPQPLVSSVPVAPMAKSPLAGPPYVYVLEHRKAAEISREDQAVLAARTPELKKQAQYFNFDLDSEGWSYQQIICPAFPDYLFLEFSHGPEPNGSSRFAAVLERDGPFVRVAPQTTHGLRAPLPPWKRPVTYEAFNHVLRRERGLAPLSDAPNWLVIGMCFAELTGDHVQVFTAKPLPAPSMDLIRLGAQLPQMNVATNQSTVITFSDASVPALNTNWLLTFDRRGQIVSAARSSQRQPRKLALKP